MVKHKRKYTLDFEKMDKFLADTAIAHKIFMKRIEEIRKSNEAGKTIFVMVKKRVKL
jgi:hypothetical protein